MIEDKRIVITGAGGYVGTALFNRLKPFNPIGLTYNPVNIKTNMIDIDLRDGFAVEKVFNKYKPNIVFHLAALTNPTVNEKNKNLAWECNVGITNNIINCIPKDTHFIYHSTDKVLNGSIEYPDDEAEPSPDNYHGELKAECEALIKKSFARHHILRLSVIHSNIHLNLISKMVGPGSFIDFALSELKNNKKVKAFKNIFRCFTLREELIQLHRALIENNQYGTYNVGSEMTNYYDRIKYLCEQNGVDTDCLLFESVGDVKPSIQNMNTSKLKKNFPNISFT